MSRIAAITGLIFVVVAILMAHGTGTNIFPVTAVFPVGAWEPSSMNLVILGGLFVLIGSCRRSRPTLHR